MKLAFYTPGTVPVTVLRGAYCGFCMEMKECVAPIVSPNVLQQDRYGSICMSCAKDVQMILKKHGVIPGQVDMDHDYIKNPSIGPNTPNTLSGSSAMGGIHNTQGIQRDSS